MVAAGRVQAMLHGMRRCNAAMPNDTLRDAAFQSIIASERSTVKANLSWKLDAAARYASAPRDG